jgi:hypothetical protein
MNATQYLMKIKENASSIQVIEKGNSQDSNSGFSGWIDTTSLFSEWEDFGDAYEQGFFSPTPSIQTANYNQSSNYKQMQKQFEQKREENTYTLELRNKGVEIETQKEITAQENREINVSNTGVYSGYYSCGTYSPSTSTVASGTYFNQYRSCLRDYTRTYTHKFNLETIHTNSVVSTSSINTSRGNYGTKDVSISASYGCPSGSTASTIYTDKCYTLQTSWDANGNCPSGYTKGRTKCTVYINKIYSCPSGYRLSGTRCNP